MVEGTLVLDPHDKTSRLVVRWTPAASAKKSKKKGGGRLSQAPVVSSEVSQPLLETLERSWQAGERAKLSVEFDLDGGKPVRVRPPGEEFEAPRNPAGWLQDTGSPVAMAAGRQQAAAGKQPGAASATPRQGAAIDEAAERDGFLHPYYYVPTPSREALQDGPLGDTAPPSHARYHPDRLNARLTIILTAATPVLALDNGREGCPPGHRIHGTRPDPFLTETGLKGAVRVNYEMVTNSRFPFFEHDQPVAYRMNVTEAPQMRPLRVREVDQGHLVLERMQQAWLPYFDWQGSAGLRLEGEPPCHQQRVRARLRRYKRQGPYDDKPIRIWGVVAISQPGEALAPTDDHDHFRTHTTARDLTTSYTRDADIEPQIVTGYVCVTSASPEQANAANKRFERLFFPAAEDPEVLEFSGQDADALRASWDSVIAAYRERVKAGQQPPHGESAHATRPGRWELQPGTLCYGRWLDRDGGKRLVSLSPVVVGRKTYPATPLAHLPSRHRPARELGELSPADRLFGWVSPTGSTQRHSSYRGNLRPQGLRALDGATAHRLDPPVVMAVRDRPKPSYARFYLGNGHGEPLAWGGSREDRGYGGAANARLRGRKAYPHQPHPDDYWQRADAEFRAVAQEPAASNHTIESWLPAGTRWRWQIEVTNATPAELGALIWMLQRDAGEYLKVGGGKPFGFGSVHPSIDWEDSTVWSGADRRRALLAGRPHAAPPAAADSELIAGAVAAYREAIETAYSAPLEEVAFVADWLAACRGRAGLATHYPRTSRHRDADTAGYAWFQQNEHRDGRGRSLPAMLQPLPYNPKA